MILELNRMNNNRHFRFLGEGIIASLLFYSCSEIMPSSEPDYFYDETAEEIERIQLSSTQKANVAKSNNFAIELLSCCNLDEGVTLCPLSIQTVLAVLNDGVEGVASKEIIEALGFKRYSDEVIDTYYHNIVCQLPKLSGQSYGSVSSFVFYDNSVGLRQEYLSRINHYYGAYSRGVDFGDWINTRQSINHWVEEATAGMIKDYAEDDLSETLVLLLNATVLSANWVFPFNPELTKKGVFIKQDKTVVQKSLMHNLVGLQFYESKDYKAVSLPLGKDGKSAYSFIPVLPAEGKSVSEILEKLDINTILSQSESSAVDLLIPIFEDRSVIDLIPLLRTIGIKTVFSSEADLSPMLSSGRGGVVVNRVMQKSVFRVDESGIEAAAATDVAIGYSSPSNQSAEQFYANRPFLWFIVENSSGIIVFEGVYAG